MKKWIYFLLCVQWSGLFLMFPRDVHASSISQNQISSVVQIRSQVKNTTSGNYEDYSLGSGFFISSDGKMITNSHVVLTDLYTTYDRYVICIQANNATTPSCTYTANLLFSDDDVDLAVLQLTGYDVNGKTITPPIYTVNWGSSANLQIGDGLDILGYPDVGGSTITLTKGTVSGFTYSRFDPTLRLWIKTDAKLNPGNSGGVVLDKNGSFVAIPTFTSSGTEKIGYLRPSDLVQEWFHSAQERINTSTPPIIIKAYPDYITDLRAIPGDQKVDLHWSATFSSDGIKYYEVVYDTKSLDIDNMNGDSMTFPHYFTTTQTNTTISHLQNGTTYYFYVRPVTNQNNPSDYWSDEAIATPSAVVVQQLFTDVSSAYKNYLAISYLKQNNIVAGYQDGSFRPDQTINRAEMVKMIVAGLQGTPDAMVYKNCFPDVHEEWFATYICYAKEKGWINGYPDGTFKPANLVNRAESLKIIVNAYGIGTNFNTGHSSYIDVPLDSWYAPYVSSAENIALLEEASSFTPGRQVTRANVAENIYRAALMQKTTVPSSSSTWKTPSGELVQVSDYYPLATGREWTYTSMTDNSNGSYTTRITGMCPQDPTCFISQSNTSENHLRLLSDRVVEIQEQSNNNQFSTPIILEYQHPMVLFSNRNLVSYFQVKHPEMLRTDKFNITIFGGINNIQLMGFETVDTPTGQQQALKIHTIDLFHSEFSMPGMTSPMITLMKIEGDEYYVKNIGLVKSQKETSTIMNGQIISNNTETDTLTSYK